MSLDLTASRVQRDTPRRPSAAPRLFAELRRRAAATPDGAVLVTIAELAAALDVEERTIRRARADLTVTGLIEVSGSDDRYAPNTYRVNV